ncbi:6-phosphogluconolactonase, partial [bacterium]|nr:6-phosphogluconolactonase [bacterium]
EVAAAISRETAQIQKFAAAGSFSLALSGGSTPKHILNILAGTAESAGEHWKAIHFFWGDERCVPSESDESNFGEAWRIFLKPAKIAPEFIHSIEGSNKPAEETERYAGEIKRLVPIGPADWPRFDWIWLGLGTDGHTASLFPGATTLNDNEKICLVAQHPQSGQLRISLTPSLLNHAKRVTFLVTGASKAEIAAQVLSDETETSLFPAARVSPQDGLLELYMDAAAARLLPAALRDSAHYH